MTSNKGQLTLFSVMLMIFTSTFALIILRSRIIQWATLELFGIS